MWTTGVLLVLTHCHKSNQQLTHPWPRWLARRVRWTSSAGAVNCCVACPSPTEPLSRWKVSRSRHRSWVYAVYKLCWVSDSGEMVMVVWFYDGFMMVLWCFDNYCRSFWWWLNDDFTLGVQRWWHKLNGLFVGQKFSVADARCFTRVTCLTYAVQGLSPRNAVETMDRLNATTASAEDGHEKLIEYVCIYIYILIIIYR